MSETLSLAFAFAWLFAVPPAQSTDTASDVPMKSLSSEHRRHQPGRELPLEKKNRSI